MNIKKHPIIGIVGKGDFKGEFAAHEPIAEEIGKLIAIKDYWLLCGGKAGMMEAASRGARKAGGLTIGILPKAIKDFKDGDDDKDLPNPHIDIAIFTGLGGGRDGRNKVIVNTCDVIIALPGSNERKRGTRSEIDLAVGDKVPVVLHRDWKTVSDPGPIPEEESLVMYFDTAEEAVEKAIAVIDKKRTDKVTLTTSRRE